MVFKTINSHVITPASKEGKSMMQMTIDVETGKVNVEMGDANGFSWSKKDKKLIIRFLNGYKAHGICQYLRDSGLNIRKKGGKKGEVTITVYDINTAHEAADIIDVVENF